MTPHPSPARAALFFAASLLLSSCATVPVQVLDPTVLPDPPPPENCPQDALCASTLLTHELNAIGPDIWSLGLAPSEGTSALVCGLECYARQWQAPRGLLSLTIARHEDAETAEAIVQGMADLAMADLGFTRQVLGRVEFMPDHTWLGIQSDEDQTTFFSVSQYSDYMVILWLFAFAPPLSTQDTELQIKYHLLIAAEQWGKLYRSGLLHEPP